MRHSTTKLIAVLVQVIVPPLLTCWSPALDCPAGGSGPAGVPGAGSPGQVLKQVWPLHELHVLRFQVGLLGDCPGPPHLGPHTPLLRWAQSGFGVL